MLSLDLSTWLFASNFLQCLWQKNRVHSNVQMSLKQNTSPAADGLNSVDERRKDSQGHRICTSLRQLDRMWRDRTASRVTQKKVSVRNNDKTDLETEENYRKRMRIELHPDFQEAGIVHRLPRWDNFETNYQPNIDIFQTTRIRHSDHTYADLCCRLLNCLKGRARLFSKCEFFYSDLDRGW
jgi:hypothetical protein